MTRPQNRGNNNSALLIGTLVAAALIALALFAGRGENATEQTQANQDANAKAAFDLSNKPMAGEESAPVEMIVVEDFKCPACKRFEAEVYPQVQNEYIRTGQVKSYFVTWPFLAEMAQLDEDDSKYAAQAVQCAFENGGSDAFNQYKSILFRAQGPANEIWASKQRLKELAGNVGAIDQAAFGSCLDSDATLATVEANEKEALASGVNSTPTVFINGEKVEDTTQAGVKAAIDAALAQ